MPIMIVFAIAAAALMIPVMVSWMRQSDQTMLGTVAARQLYAVTQAAKGYITAYAGTIEATATSTTPATITVPMLVATGFLPQGFGAVNPYQQGWEVEVLQPSPGDLQALALSTGGQPIPPRDAPRIGAEAGSAGGAVTNAGTAQGSFGGWTVSLTNYPNPGVGHLAALIDYSNGQLQNDYLYRTAVPGQPQLNTMQTGLDMGGNNVTNAQNVSVNNDVTLGNPGPSTGGSAASEPGQLGVNEPAGQGFPSGWGGGIHTWDAYANGTVGAGTNGSLNAYLNNAGVVYAGDQLQLGTANGQANVGWGCGPNGSVAANANGSGQLMVCQGGSWQPAAPPPRTTSTWSSGWIWNNQSANLGWANICAESGWNGGPPGSWGADVYPVAGPNSLGQYDWVIVNGPGWHGYGGGIIGQCYNFS